MQKLNLRRHENILRKPRQIWDKRVKERI